MTTGMGVVLGLLMSLFSFQWSLAQSHIVEKVYQGISKSSNAQQARQEIISKAIESVTAEIGREMIGEAKYNRSRSLIASRILKNSGRYVPSFRPGAMRKSDTEFNMSVTVQIDTKILETMFLENGLLYEFEGSPVVLPVIHFLDRVQGKSAKWWYPGSSQSEFILQQQSIVENQMQKAFTKVGFFGERPSQTRMFEVMSKHFSRESFDNERLQLLGQDLNAHIVLSGDWVIEPAKEAGRYLISVKITVMQASNGRVITEMLRKVETAKGTYESVVSRKMREVSELVATELATQVHEAWQKGTFGASLAKIVVRGGLSSAQLVKFKDAVKAQSKSVRTIRERLIASDSVVFEIEISGAVDEIARSLASLKLDETSYRASEVRGNSILVERQ